MNPPVVPLAHRLRLMVISDPDTGAGRGLLDIVRGALRGGAPAIQLRAKAATAREMLELARALAPEIRSAGALFLVNDRVDIALSAGAGGAHLGDDDLPLSAARAIAPPGFVLGRSADTVEQARAAEREGADYIGAGPVYVTASKADAGIPIGPDGIRNIASAVGIPVVGIGGIKNTTAGAVTAAGAAGVAIIRAVINAPDPERATRALLREITR